MLRIIATRFSSTVSSIGSQAGPTTTLSGGSVNGSLSRQTTAEIHTSDLGKSRSNSKIAFI